MTEALFVLVQRLAVRPLLHANGSPASSCASRPTPRPREKTLEFYILLMRVLGIGCSAGQRGSALAEASLTHPTRLPTPAVPTDNCLLDA